VKLEDLADLLPGNFAVDLADESKGFSLPDAKGQEYVWPTLNASAGDVAPVVLISAAGAMGKSAAAKAIARRRGLVLLDTAVVRVGSNTVSGGLAKAIGAEKFAEFLHSFRSGQTGLVVDGLDEALLYSGSEHFEEFLQDLCWLASESSGVPQVVMLGRDEAIDHVQLLLEEWGVDLTRLSLAPLDHEAASCLIDLTLDTRPDGSGTYSVHRNFPEPFGQLRDRVLLDLGRALDSDFASLESWPMVAAFLGYAPVLQALAERLAVANPSAELAEVESRTSESKHAEDQGSLLLEVVRTILAREQQKVSLHVGNALGMRPDDPVRRALYTEQEQVRRLLALVGDAEDTEYGPEVLEPHERQAYDTQIRSFLADHPFVRGRQYANRVFADFVRAYSYSAPLLGAQLPRIKVPSLDVGPFFAQFYGALLRDQAPPAGDPLETPLALVDILVRSIRLAFPRCVWRFTKWPGTQGLLEVYTEPDTPSVPISFVTPDAEDILQISSPLAHCEVLTNLPVILQGRANEVRIGPGVLIQCGSLVIEGEALRVAPRRLRGQEGSSTRGGFGVYIEVEDGIEADPRLRLILVEDDCFRVAGTNLGHPWMQYRFEPPPLPPLVQVSLWTRAVAITRRVLTSMHPLANGNIGSNAELLRRYTAASEFGATVIEGLHELGVLTSAGNYEILSQDQLSSRGINYNSLNGADPHSQLEPLLQDLFRTPAMSRYVAGGGA